MFGWGSHNDLTRIDAVSVYDSQFCDSNFPHNFCSSFTSRLHYSCDALLGSPVTCGDESIINGFLINNGSCNPSNGQYILNYHSVSEFESWIENRTIPGSGVVKQVSMLVFMSAVIINLI